ncbi:MAG: hypothetical protein RL341_44 [Pseudomonadota bacterium]
MGSLVKWCGPERRWHLSAKQMQMFKARMMQQRAGGRLAQTRHAALLSASALAGLELRNCLGQRFVFFAGLAADGIQLGQLRFRLGQIIGL